MSPLDDLVNSMGAVIIDPDGPVGKMESLTSRLAQTMLRSISLDERAARYCRHHLREILQHSSLFQQQREPDPHVQAVLKHYSSWVYTEDSDLCDELAPKDGFTLTVLSRAMVEMIVPRARNGDAIVPPQSPQDHSCCPFQSRLEEDCWWLERIGRTRGTVLMSLLNLRSDFGDATLASGYASSGRGESLV
jgi:hypothetical protein